MLVLRAVGAGPVSANYSGAGLIELSNIGVNGVSEFKTELNRVLALEFSFNIECFASEVSIARNFTSRLVQLEILQVYLSDLA